MVFYGRMRAWLREDPNIINTRSDQRELFVSATNYCGPSRVVTVPYVGLPYTKRSYTKCTDQTLRLFTAVVKVYV